MTATDFVTIEQAKTIFSDFIDKSTMIMTEFKDYRLLKGLINQFTIKEAMIITPLLPLVKEVHSNPESISENECELRVVESCCKTVALLNILLLAQVDIEKSASEHMTQHAIDRMLPLMTELKQVLTKIKEIYEPVPANNPPNFVIEDLWN